MTLLQPPVLAPTTLPDIMIAPPAKATTPAKVQRLLSLDVFRGVTIAAMILVNNMGSPAYEPLDHADVMETTRRVRGQFIALLEGIIGRL